MTVQTLKDMLRACALEWTCDWDKYLNLVEFAYKNSWHTSIGDHVFLKVSPYKGVKRFGMKGKLSPRIALPPQLSHLHNVFHVSLLRGYKFHPLHVVQNPLYKIREYLSCEKEVEAILAREERVLRKNIIPFLKVLWKNHYEKEATWD
ncbi:uncharacterized protein LOC141674071 [Apium graveolens]|uniref:uncharacterized protein LOC141674071 n=1 Tax=Apium graveolens TaxID=4045 RepID=UPI003D7AD363